MCVCYVSESLKVRIMGSDKRWAIIVSSKKSFGIKQIRNYDEKNRMLWRKISHDLSLNSTENVKTKYCVCTWIYIYICMYAYFLEAYADSLKVYELYN